MTDGATGVARTALEAAVAGWDAKRRIWEASWARLDLANCLIRSDRFAEALPLVVDARTLASRLDAGRSRIAPTPSLAWPVDAWRRRNPGGR